MKIKVHKEVEVRCLLIFFSLYIQYNPKEFVAKICCAFHVSFVLHQSNKYNVLFSKVIVKLYLAVAVGGRPEGLQ